MISGQLKVPLNVESVLNKVTEYDIFMYYMPEKGWKLNRVTFSPFRNERNPSFIIGDKHGSLYFIDFADTSFRGNCFIFVKMLFNLPTLNDVLLRVDKDFGLGIINKGVPGKLETIKKEYKQPEDLGKRYCLIQAITRPFNNEELEYWNGYHQDKADLRQNNIYAIKSLYMNKKLFSLKPTELVFGYLYDGHWKIYRPYGDKKSKWVPNNVPITAMDGREDIQNCNVAFINKSKKDYMVMKKVFPCCCAVQNEGVACFSPENVEYIKANSTSQILSFDSDVTGVTNSQQITKLFDFGYCNVPRHLLKEGIKDWADWSKVYGLKPIEDYLKQKQLL
jgi:hypothetical protein